MEEYFQLLEVNQLTVRVAFHFFLECVDVRVVTLLVFNVLLGGVETFHTLLLALDLAGFYHTFVPCIL